MLSIDPQRAKLLPCHHAIQVAKGIGVRKVILQTDCASVVGNLKKKYMDHPCCGPLVEEIKMLLKDCKVSLTSHLCCLGNEVAHQFARIGCVNKSCNIAR
jgi:hypothetical protein